MVPGLGYCANENKIRTKLLSCLAWNHRICYTLGGREEYLHDVALSLGGKEDSMSMYEIVSLVFAGLALLLTVVQLRKK